MNTGLAAAAAGWGNKVLIGPQGFVAEWCTEGFQRLRLVMPGQVQPRSLPPPPPTHSPLSVALY